MPSSLRLADYRSVIGIDEVPQVGSDPDWRALLVPVLDELDVSAVGGRSVEELVRALHGALARIEPYALSADLIDRIEAIARGVNDSALPVDALLVPTVAERLASRYPASAHVSLWTGDITRLKVDAIVNAANAELLGCRIPNHACIDNAIHSAAGPRLRDDCATIVRLQGAPERVGAAKVTRGYALAAPFVLHTVGPQLRPGASPSDVHRRQLASAYRSCLDLAAELPSIRALAFCAISTGVFAYPKIEAAGVAIRTVADWLDAHPGRFDRIVFDQFSAEDTALYGRLLRDW